MFGLLELNIYLYTDKSRPLSIRTAYPAGHFLFMCNRYTKLFCIKMIGYKA